MALMLEQQVISSNNCSRRRCSTTFSSFSTGRNYYSVRITSTNDLGQTSQVSASRNIGEQCMPNSYNYFILNLFLEGSNVLSILFNTSNCMVSFLCNSSVINGTCTFQYSMSPSFDDLSDPIHSELNEPVTLPLLTPTSLCYYIVTSTVINFEIRGNFHTAERK